MEKVRPGISNFAGKIPARTGDSGTGITEDLALEMNIPEHEGLIVPSQINYVGKGADLYRSGYTYHGSARVITRYLRTSWLWDSIRVRGTLTGLSVILINFPVC